jgi:tRNA-specific 2-thiouridylase
VGSHQGAHGFTVGQRKGLRIDRPAPDGRPRYVLSIEPVSNTVTVGPRSALEVTTITCGAPVWNGPSGRDDLTVQLRAHGEVYPCRFEERGGGLTIELARPATGVAGYSGATVIGSATIVSAS